MSGFAFYRYARCTVMKNSLTPLAGFMEKLIIKGINIILFNLSYGNTDLPNQDASLEVMERPVGECRRAAITNVGTPIIIPRASSSRLCARVAST